MSKTKRIIECYSDKISVSNDEEINFKVHCLSEKFSISFQRIEDNLPLLDISNLEGKIQPLRKNAFLGVDWETSYTLKVPQNWKSGIYVAKVKTNKEQAYSFFTVRGTNSEIAVLASTHTWQAYNYWGNASLYSDIEGCSKSSIVSCNRPLLSKIPLAIDSMIEEKPFGKQHIMNYERMLFQWLNNQNYKYDVISDPELHTQL